MYSDRSLLKVMDKSSLEWLEIGSSFFLGIIGHTHIEHFGLSS